MEQSARYGLLTARILIAVVFLLNGFGIIDQSIPARELVQRGAPADSSLAGGNNPRWGRRAAAVLAMLTGAIAGTSMLAYSVAAPLFVCGVMTAICALARLHVSRKEL